MFHLYVSECSYRCCIHVAFNDKWDIGMLNLPQVKNLKMSSGTDVSDTDVTHTFQQCISHASTHGISHAEKKV